MLKPEARARAARTPSRTLTPQARNTKMLGILELVVQRTCAEMEAAMPDVQLLTALLQTKNQVARQEMYARELRPADGSMQARFAESVHETQLHLEKAVMRGEEVRRDACTNARTAALTWNVGRSVCEAARTAAAIATAAHRRSGVTILRALVHAHSGTLCVRSSHRLCVRAQIDMDLLQQLRVIALEMTEYIEEQSQ